MGASTANVEKGNIPILEGLARFPLQKLLESMDYTLAIREAEREAKGTIEDRRIDVCVGNVAPG